MPTYERLARFGADFRRLTPAQQAAFLAAVSQFVADLDGGRGLRPRLRVKGVQGAPGIFEMTWAPNAGATFQYGEPLRSGETHVVWRRVGTHDGFGRP